VTRHDPPPPLSSRRPDVRSSLARDLKRYEGREPGSRSFWRSLSVLGAVGWPIVACTVGGALLGRWIDGQWNAGIRWTLSLLVAGAVIGATIAWRVVRPRSR
jgi:ATP synthase protein I